MMPLQNLKSAEITQSNGVPQAAAVFSSASPEQSLVGRPAGEDPPSPDDMLLDETDEIQQEIDVFLSPPLAEQLHLLQYPLTQTKDSSPAASFIDTLGRPSEGRFKPMHGQLELEIPLPENMEREGDYAFVGDRRAFSSQTIPVQTHLCLGRLVSPGGVARSEASTGEDAAGSVELHLIPIAGIKQMRPSFHHVDAEDQLEMNLVSEMDQQDRPFDKKPVLYQRKESDRAMLARKSSYAYQKASEDSEAWSTLSVHLPRSKEYNQTMHHAYCRNRSKQVLAEATTQSTYVQSLHYQIGGGGASISMQRSPHLRTDPKSLVRHVTSKMLGGGPVPFDVLRASFASDGVPDRQLLRALSVAAVLVRGNFVLNSRFLPPGVSPHVARARTLILLLLEMFGRLSRPQLDRVYAPAQPDDSPRLSSERLLMILEQLAIRAADGWVLKLPDDTSFSERFPEEAAVYERYWKKQETRFRSEIQRFSESNPSINKSSK